MIVSWSDDEEPNGDGESETTKHVAVMTGRIVSESESGEDVLYHEELTVPYNIDTCKQLEEQK